MPDPETGQLTADFEDLPQVPFEDFDLHLFASDRGLMATPTQLHHLHRRDATSIPWNAALADQTLELRSSASTRAPTAAPARARSAPSTRAWSPAPRTPTPAPSATSP